MPLEKDDLFRYSQMYQEFGVSFHSALASGMMPFVFNLFKQLGFPFVFAHYFFVVLILIVKYSLYNLVKQDIGQNLILFIVVFLTINLKSTLLGFRSPLSTYLFVYAYFLINYRRFFLAFIIIAISIWTHKIAVIFSILMIFVYLLKYFVRGGQLLFVFWLVSFGIFLIDFNILIVNQRILNLLNIFIDLNYYDDYIIGNWSTNADRASLTGSIYRSLLQIPYLLVQVLLILRIYWNKEKCHIYYYVILLSIALNILAPISDISLRMLALPWQVGIIYLLRRNIRISQSKLERSLIVSTMAIYFFIGAYSVRDYLSIFLKVPLYEIM